MTTLNLKALACEDCPAAVTVQRGQGAGGAVLTVVVEHADSCPWAAACVPAVGALLVRPGALLWHRRAGDPAELPW